jgi:diaminopimelate decarboxylase
MEHFKANINIKRMESNCGIYLKWFNANGGIHTDYSDTTSTKPLMKLLVNMTT